MMMHKLANFKKGLSSVFGEVKQWITKGTAAQDYIKSDRNYQFRRN